MILMIMIMIMMMVIKVRNEQTLGVWSDLVYDSIVLAKDELELAVVRLELLFLEENDFGTLWDLNADTGQAFGLSDEGEDLRIEVDVQLVVIWMSDNESGKKTSLCLLDLNNPSLPPFIFKVEQSVCDSVVVSDLLHGLLSLLGSEQLLGEVLHWD